MRIAIFSDIHGNLEALQAVIDAYKKDKIDKYIFLGDAVGYGANPNECCDLIKNVAEHSILGNHDAACCNRLSYDWFNPVAKDAIIWSKDNLNRKNRRWLESLKYSFEFKHLLVSHGLPLVPEVFEYDDNILQIKNCLENLKESFQICFMGHTHRPLVFIKDPNLEKILIDNSEQIKIKPDNKYLVNVGSVGQPRDANPYSCYTIHDTKKMTLTFHRLKYDVEKAAQKIRKVGLPPMLADRLLFGL